MASAVDEPESRVLCVAEKPSVARAVAEALSGGKHCTRGKGGPLQTHMLYAYFAPAKKRCSVAVTSVVGHVFGLDFLGGAEKRGDISSIFAAKTQKVVEETSERLGVANHLREQADGVGWLCLWLDCDREGENICFEVLSLLPQYPADRVWRAKFSAVTEREVRGAWAHLAKPSAAEASAVDARQELDLKVGVTFTRLLTRALRDAARKRFSLPALRLLSYGPCQTPTLWFTCQRQKEIDAFVPQQYWELSAHVTLSVGASAALKWSRNPCFDESLSRRAAAAAERAGQLEVRSATCSRRAFPPPVGMNTVALLKLASAALGLSPHRAMQIAEELYTAGLVSYPRTESARYPPSFDVAAALSGHEHSAEVGPLVRWLQLAPRAPPRGGTDAGDHPPITPMRYSSRGGVRGGPAAYSLYSAIVKHFVATLLPAASADERTLRAVAGGETYELTWHRMLERGWLHALPHRAEGLGLVEGLPGALDSVASGAVLPLRRLERTDGWTVPPDPLRESELIEAMDKHGIGTDASMATHVTTIVERGYASVVDKDGQPLGEEGMGGGGGGKGKGKGGGGKGKGGKGGGKGGGASEGGGGGRFMVPSAVGLALVDGLGAVDPQLVRPELRASMEAMVARIACGEAQRTEVVSKGLAAFKSQFEKLKRGMHLLEPHFGELGRTDREGEGGQDELIRLEVAAQAGKQTLSDWKRARAIEEQLEVAADVADATERERRQRDREEAGGGATVDEAQKLLRSLFTANTSEEEEAIGAGESAAAALFERTAAAAAAGKGRGKGKGRSMPLGKGGRGGGSAPDAPSDVPALSDWLAKAAPSVSAAAAEPAEEVESEPKVLRGRAKARADAAASEAADAAERTRLLLEREEAMAARPAKSAAEELARSLFSGPVSSAPPPPPAPPPPKPAKPAETPRTPREGESQGAPRSERGGGKGGGKGDGGKGAVKGGGGKGGGGKGGKGSAAAPAPSAPAAPMSRWEQMEAERAARAAADGGSRTAFAGGLASTHGLTEAEREQRDGAQRKIKKALGTAEGREKVLADPKKLPTVKAPGTERWLCQWEQLGMACGHLGAEHFERNAHKICAYCLVIGHPLVRCELAAKEGVDLKGLTAAVSAAAAPAPAPTGGGRGKGSGKGGRGR